jgi:hypothetical protein
MSFRYASKQFADLRDHPRLLPERAGDQKDPLEVFVTAEGEHVVPSVA